MNAWDRALLRLYPAPFRERHGAELISAIHDDHAIERRAGFLGGLRFWTTVSADVAASAFRLRARQTAASLRRIGGRGTPRLSEPERRTAMDALLQDLQYAFRQSARAPGFTVIAVLSLGLAIGGNSLVYGIVDGFVLTPFPYPQPDRLVSVGVTFPKLSNETTYIEALSPAEYGDIRTAQTFAIIAAFDLGNRNLSGGNVPERLFTALLLDDLFPVLGMKPALGRGFTRDELKPRGPDVAIISHRIWQSRFGGDPGILHRTVSIGGSAASIVGVMPPGLVLLGTDLWIPWGGDVAQVPRNARQFNVLARLAPQASLAQANAELASVARRVEQAEASRFKEYEGWRLVATPWSAAVMQDVRPAGFMMIGAVAFVLLIACANLASLFLARSTMRQREFAVRIALGAARWRVARQLLVESLLLSAAGAALGLAIAWAGLRGAGALVPAQFQMLGLEARVSGRVLAWTIAAAVLAGVLVALLPALQAMRTDPHESLKTDGRTGPARAGRRTRHALVVAEIALSVALLLGAGLLMRSFLNLQRVDPGFDPENVLTMRLTLPQGRYPNDEAQVAFFERLVARVAAVPGVRAASMASQFPPLGPFSNQIEVEGARYDGTTLPTANTTIVSRDHFHTLGIPVVRGRSFTVEDRAGVPRRVIVNEAFAARYLKDRDPVSARVRLAGRARPGPFAEIVGVVGDTRNVGMTSAPRPEIFTAMEQGSGWNQLFLLVRTGSAPETMLPVIREAIASLDPDQPVYAIQTLNEAIADSAFQTRTSGLLLGIFAGLALLLAAVGIFGVMSYSVGARTHEMGVRMAVGAERTDVLRLVLGQVVRLAVAGLVIGVGLLFATRRALESLLYGVTPSDVLTITLVTLLLGIVALAAGWVPAHRASRVNPIEALRYE